jgi:3-oxoacyl-[acyl-carrier protein] reductase
MLQELKTLCEPLAVPCHCFICDSSDAKTVNSLMKQLEEEKIAVDVFIHNAGISHIGLTQDMSVLLWQQLINTNLNSAFYFTKALIPQMVAKQDGRILFISSVWGTCGASCETAYSASKGGLNTFTKALAKELAPSHIAVNAIACGAIDTEMNSFLSPEEKAALEAEIPAGRMGLPEEVASFALQLASAPEYLTGQVIGFDGAWL